MSHYADTATPVVIVNAIDAGQLTEHIKEFLRNHIIDTRRPERMNHIRFLTAPEAPLHGLRTIEFIGFTLAEQETLNDQLENLYDFYLDKRAGKWDDILVTVNPAVSHVLQQR